jgi:hypothetical protein
MDKEKTECAVSFFPDGTISAVYKDDLIFEGQRIEVTRVSEVEFDNENQEWVARLKKTGEIIARNKKRETVLLEEVRAVQEMLFQGIDIKPDENQEKQK